MAYDEDLAARVRRSLQRRSAYEERKMFGGLCFMVAGNMVCGVMRDELMVRVGKDGHESALSLPHARAMDFTGRPMTGMVYVESDGVADTDEMLTVLVPCLDLAHSIASASCVLTPQ